MKILSWNLENFFLPSVLIKYSNLNVVSKSEHKLNKIKLIMQELDPDIMCLSEIGTKESLEEFNQKYLLDDYIPSLIEGNSDRGIEIGFLVKRNLGLKFEHYTHKNRILNFHYPHEDKNISSDKKLSRDIAELRIFKKNEKDPSMIILLVHLKSKQDELRVDPESNIRRYEELKLLYKLQLNLKIKFPNCSIIITGDFNQDFTLPTSPIYLNELFARFPHTDILEITKTPLHECATFIHFEKNGSITPQQLDYILIPNELKNKVKKSFKYEFKYDSGLIIPRPENGIERMQLPSDHYPLFVNLDT